MPMPRRYRSVLAVAALAALALAVLAAPAAAMATNTGTGMWYWPTGTEDFQGRSGWWDYRARNHSWHMAQDMPAPVGHAVYAVGDGTVLESQPDAHYGGVLVVLHRTGDGRYFKAVYGHIIRAAGTSTGAKVKAGQVIGRVNHDRHVHFGIHPGRAYPPDRNPYRGHTYSSSVTYGWTDAVKYLRTYPRIVKPPAVPVVATVETTGPPTVLGVADGSAYWAIDAEAGPLVFARSLATAPASLDATRFLVVAGPASFTLADRLPILSLTASTVAPSWSKPVTLSGYLTNALGAPFIGSLIVLESTGDGVTWTRLSTTLTDGGGRYAVAFRPSRRTGMRTRFIPATAFLPAFSATTTVTPKPALSAPVAPSRATRDHPFTVRGTLTPRHAAGPGAVTLRVQRKVAGVWTDRPGAATTYRDSGTVTSYSGSLALPAGSWRFRAEIPGDAAHSAGAGGWTYLILR
jgi:murein DD-endopeptidase MepM/ murein hydrolase activator NlpD